MIETDSSKHTLEILKLANMSLYYMVLRMEYRVSDILKKEYAAHDQFEMMKELQWLFSGDYMEYVYSHDNYYEAITKKGAKLLEKLNKENKK